MTDSRPHPYLPNATPNAVSGMLDHIGVDTLDDLFCDVPVSLRQQRGFGLPSALRSESELIRYVRDRLRRNTSADDALLFCGAGTYFHDIPSVCTEVAGRAEFVSAYAGEPYEDHGKHQALFEYQSLMAELLEMDVVSIPSYDGFQAAGTALRMASRITGRSRAVVYGAMLSDRRSRIDEYAAPALTRIDYLPSELDLNVLRDVVDDACAAVLVELPDAHGLIDVDLAEVATLAHSVGAIVIVSVDPIALGLLSAPARLGADIVCGDLQSLGNGMHFGGAHAGLLAVHDDPTFVYELPTRLYGLAPTVTDGEIGFIDIAYERTSLAARENGVEWIGTASASSGIIAATFLALHGPSGLVELSESIFDRTSYAIDRLDALTGFSVVDADRPHFREFVLQTENSTSSAVLMGLAESNIFGGVPISGDRILVCVTEAHTLADIDTFATTLENL
ncbi:aminomethyl-transferring glycine dehydrogenase subunit GcvPA [Rhodococcus fascians]|nr:aminomethyl-transferring glycine dehydrogenase subunit GcvPA [Rhodococcus fascians]MBY3826537.1 aminomethyl-transferring glycine dehydrogenase subunit GcvPA [Rhodococcus fascians]MBY3836998.1 aminomethyl-transferring glycine dehydrogenase subunit GcvPA [Rhodococcus fascians]MBY3865535.1 aminomethyl-transferring glycine dehydrogenase subunit GcvPA [Rhodococcus fascians]MBY3885679.1 aminomethyl-transferring glycine dehydrogenase subunit GcvPA [Rhodococcus fascians]